MRKFSTLILLLMAFPFISLQGQNTTTEGFEWDFSPPVGWEASSRWGPTAAGYTGKAIFCSYTNAPNEPLTSARMDLTAGNNQVSFFWRSNATPVNEVCSVIVAVSYDAGESWLQLDTLYGTNGPWVQQAYTLTNNTSDHAYFRWTYQGNGIYVDGARSFSLDEVSYPRWYPQQPELFAFPGDSLLFGTAEVFQTVEKAFKVYNFGQDVLEISAIAILGEHASDFGLVNVDLPISVAMLQSAQIDVQMAPLSGGYKNASLSITHNGSESPFILPLHGYSHDPVLYPPFMQVFNTFPPQDWIEARGIISENTEFTSTTSSWGIANFGNKANGSSSARVSVILTRNEWLITPPIYLLDDPDLDYMLSFDLALTIRNTTDSANFDSSKFLYVVISGDNGQTWSINNILATWDETTPISPNGQHETVLISGYSGHIRLAFYGRSTANLGTHYDVFVDNVKVAPVSDTDIAPPMLISLQGTTQVENKPMELSLTVWDESMVSSVVANYTIGDGETQSITMTLAGEVDDDENNGGDDKNSADGTFFLFTGIIPAPEGPATGNVYFTMMDEFGNVGNSEQLNISWYADTEGPVIQWVSFPSVLGLNLHGKVAVDLDDPSGISYAALIYTLEGMLSDTLELLIGDDGLYHGNIPAQNTPASVLFKILAIDASSQHNTTVSGQKLAVWVDASTDELPIANQNHSQGNPVVAFNGEQYFVVFNDRRLGSSTSAFWGRFVDVDGSVHIDTEVQVAEFTWQPFYFPNLVFGGDHFLMSWAQQRSPTDTNRDYVAQVLTADGQPVGGRLQVSPQQATNTASFSASAFDGEKFLTVWQQGSPREIWGRFISTDGNNIGQPFNIRSEAIPANADQMVPSVVYTGSNFMVSWDDNRSGNRNIYGQIIKNTGEFVGPDFHITTPEAHNKGISRMIKAEGRILVAWEDNRDHIRSSLYGRLIDLKGNQVGQEFAISIVEEDLSRTWVSLGSNGNEFFVSWNQQFREGVVLSYDIYGARINMMGQIIGEPFAICTAGGSQSNSKIATNGQDFLVVWEDGRAGAWDTYGKLYAGSLDEEPPVAVELLGNVAMTGHDMHLLLNVSNASPMESVSGVYTIDEQSGTIEMEAVNKGLFKFAGVIPASNVAVTGTITFSMTDVNGNYSTSEPFSIAWDEDSDPPVIEMIQTPLLAMPHQAVKVKARITDESGIASARIILTIDGEQTSIPMSGSGDYYSAWLPGQEHGTLGIYLIEATDNSPKENTAVSASFEIEWRQIDGDWYGNINAQNITGLGLQNNQPWKLGIAIDLEEKKGRIIQIAYIANQGTNAPVNWHVLKMDDQDSWTSIIADPGGLLTDNPIIGGNSWNIVDVNSEQVLEGHIGLVVELTQGGYWGRDDNAPYQKSFMFYQNNWVRLGEGVLGDFPGDWTLKCFVEYEDGSVSVIDINQMGNTRVFPNPFSSFTNISFNSLVAQHVIVTVHDINGRLMSTLADQKITPGIHNFRWNSENFEKGVYFYRIFTSSGVWSGKLLLVK
jgi:hypothetical protein